MRLDLNGSWNLKGGNFNINANVPGTVLSNLLAQGLIPDPFVGKNELEVQKYLLDDYEFTRNFKLSKEDIERTNYLCFDGLDTICEVYLNGKLILKGMNMHTRYKVLVDNLELDNEIRILFHSAKKYIDSYTGSPHITTFCESEEKNPVIRKAHYMFGWDWGPNLPDMGIFRDIYIESTNVGYLESIKYKNEFNSDYSNCILTLDSYFKVVGNASVSYNLFFEGKLIDSKELELKNENRLVFDIDSPMLWNPIGYGKPNLYDLEITIKGSEILNYKYRIGLRNIEVDDSDDEIGKKLEFSCNGNKIYIKGSDFIPQDNILNRVNYENTKHMLELVKFANHNTIRIWGGGYYLDDYFYTLCDEMGILVWQDMMFACASYDTDDNDFVSLIKEEAHDVLRRLRHHPSILLICGSNENEMAITNWVKFSKELFKKNWLKQYIEIIKPIVNEETYFYYLASSPTSGEPYLDYPNDMNKMDVHYWEVWHGNKPFEDFKKIYPRFLSEFGCQSFALYDTVLTYAKDSELDLFSPVMMHHQKNRTCNDKILNYINSLYREPRNFKSLVYKSMLSQAEGIKTCVEHLRSIRPINSGVMYWQLNDCWPGQSWSSLDYYYNLKALHYYSKKFFNEDLIVVDDKDNKVDVRVINDSITDKSYIVNLKVVSFDGNILNERKEEIKVNKSSNKVAFTYDDSLVDYCNSVIYLELILNDEVVSDSYYSKVKVKDLTLPKSKVNIEVIDSHNFYVSVDFYTKNIFLDTSVQGNVLNDNFFDLLPNVKYHIYSNQRLDYNKLQIMTLNEEELQ